MNMDNLHIVKLDFVEVMVMNKQESILLLDSMYPNFFERENVRSIPDEWIFLSYYRCCTVV